MKRDIVIKRFLKHPQQQVWQTLTNPKYLARWYMENDFEPVVGHRFQFRTNPALNFNGILDC